MQGAGGSREGELVWAVRRARNVSVKTRRLGWATEDREAWIAEAERKEACRARRALEARGGTGKEYAVGNEKGFSREKAEGALLGADAAEKKRAKTVQGAIRAEWRETLGEKARSTAKMYNRMEEERRAWRAFGGLFGGGLFKHSWAEGELDGYLREDYAREE